MIACPECGAAHYPGTLFCDACGAAVHPAARAHVAATRRSERHEVVSVPAGTPSAEPAAAAAPAAGVVPALRLTIAHCRQELTLRAALIHVGRIDPDTGRTPELDLTACGGLERGVSRRHATIQWTEGNYVLVDQHSANGTWLEGTRLVAGYTYQLPPRATVRFGDVVVHLALAD